MLDERCCFCGWRRVSAPAGSLLAQWSWKRSVLLHLKAEWTGSRTEGVVLVLCKEKDRKIGPGYVPGSFVSNLLHHTSVPHTDTSPVPSAGLQRGGVAQEEHSVPVCVTLCIYSTQSNRTHAMMLSLCTYTYPWHMCFYMYCMCRVQNFCHLPVIHSFFLSVIFYKMYV